MTERDIEAILRKSVPVLAQLDLKRLPPHAWKSLGLLEGRITEMYVAEWLEKAGFSDLVIPEDTKYAWRRTEGGITVSKTNQAVFHEYDAIVTLGSRYFMVEAKSTPEHVSEYRKKISRGFNAFYEEFEVKPEMMLFVALDNEKKAREIIRKMEFSWLKTHVIFLPYSHIEIKEFVQNVYR